jgi:hypothetical protein
MFVMASCGIDTLHTFIFIVLVYRGCPLVKSCFNTFEVNMKILYSHTHSIGNRRECV